jgi:hypothetical protein
VDSGRFEGPRALVNSSLFTSSSTFEGPRAAGEDVDTGAGAGGDVTFSVGLSSSGGAADALAAALARWSRADGVVWGAGGSGGIAGAIVAGT